MSKTRPRTQTRRGWDELPPRPLDTLAVPPEANLDSLRGLVNFGEEMTFRIPNRAAYEAYNSAIKQRNSLNDNEYSSYQSRRGGLYDAALSTADSWEADRLNGRRFDAPRGVPLGGGADYENNGITYSRALPPPPTIAEYGELPPIPKDLMVPFKVKKAPTKAPSEKTPPVIPPLELEIIKPDGTMGKQPYPGTNMSNVNSLTGIGANSSLDRNLYALFQDTAFARRVVNEAPDTFQKWMADIANDAKSQFWKNYFENAEHTVYDKDGKQTQAKTWSVNKDTKTGKIISIGLNGTALVDKDGKPRDDVYQQISQVFLSNGGPIETFMQQNEIGKQMTQKASVTTDQRDPRGSRNLRYVDPGWEYSMMYPMFLLKVLRKMSKVGG